MATSGVDGRPEAALVGIAALDDGTLIFDSRADARKVGNIRRTPEVAVVVGLGHDVSIQIEGIASLSSGAERLTYGAAYNARFPGSRALDDDFAVLTIGVRWVRVYDASTHPARVAEAVWE